MVRTLHELRELPGFGPALLTDGCPTRVVLDHVTSKWGVLVLLALSDGTLRWAELRRAVDGISEKMLAQTLRALTADGYVAREAHPVIPPRVEYRLTHRGEQLTALLLPLVEWIARDAPNIGAPSDGAPSVGAPTVPTQN